MKLRHQLAMNHPVIGAEFRLLTDDDVLLWDDETACVSTLLSIECPEQWHALGDEWLSYYGMAIGVVCDKTDDADGDERVFRRRR